MITSDELERYSAEVPTVLSIELIEYQRKILKMAASLPEGYRLRVMQGRGGRSGMMATPTEAGGPSLVWNGEEWS